MKYGLNLLLWTDRMHDGMLPVVEKIKALGYDGPHAVVHAVGPEQQVEAVLHGGLPEGDRKFTRGREDSSTNRRPETRPVQPGFSRGGGGPPCLRTFSSALRACGHCMSAALRHVLTIREQ